MRYRLPKQTDTSVPKRVMNFVKINNAVNDSYVNTIKFKKKHMPFTAKKSAALNLPAIETCDPDQIKAQLFKSIEPPPKLDLVPITTKSRYDRSRQPKRVQRNRTNTLSLTNPLTYDDYISHHDVKMESKYKEHDG